MILRNEIIGRAHYLQLRVYYEDTDFSGMVYHANYVRFFERGRSEFLRAAGIHHRALLERPDPILFTVVSIAVDFHAPARIDDVLLVETHYDDIRGPRILARQQILREGHKLASARVEACCINSAGRAIRPPSLLFEGLGPYLASTNPLGAD